MNAPGRSQLGSIIPGRGFGHHSCKGFYVLDYPGRGGAFADKAHRLEWLEFRILTQHT